jgi:hypothetical protein
LFENEMHVQYPCYYLTQHHALPSDETGIPTAKEFMTNREDDPTDENFSASQKQGKGCSHCQRIMAVIAI